MRRLFERMMRDERGATAIEYGLIIALLALAIVGSLSVISTRMNTDFNKLINALH